MYHNIEEIYYQHEKEIAMEGILSNIGRGIKSTFDKFIKWWKNWFAEMRKKLERLKIRIGHRKFQKEHPDYKFSEYKFKIHPDYELETELVGDILQLDHDVSDICEIFDQTSDSTIDHILKLRERYMERIIRLNKNFSIVTDIAKRYNSYSEEFNERYDYIIHLLKEYFAAGGYPDKLDRLNRKIWDLFNGELYTRNNDGESNFSDKEFSILEEKCNFLVEYCEHFKKFIYTINKVLEEYDKEGGSRKK